VLYNIFINFKKIFKKRFSFSMSRELVLHKQDETDKKKTRFLLSYLISLKNKPEEQIRWCLFKK